MIGKTINRGFITALAIVLGVIFSGLTSGAASALSSSASGQPNGFTISPVINEITVSKGQTQTVPITVTNPTDAPIVAVPVVNDFIASNDETGSPRLILKNNASLPSNNFKSIVGPLHNTTIQPDQSAIINVEIVVPPGAYSGGYYGAVRFVPGNSGAKTPTIGLTASVGSLFLVTVPGNLTTKLTMVQFSAADVSGNPSSFFTNGQMSALIRLYAQGNIYTQPFGTVVVKDMFGHIISTNQFNNVSPKKSILPDSTRRFVVPLAKHKYLGYYTITASIGYGLNGQGNNLIIAKASFWYVPVWLQIVILAAVVIIVILIITIVRKIRKRRFRKT